ncbi:SAVED domain-containing protein [Pyxidicoccus parkwayensis]|uniref:SAVED domain-containing protein n=1 Tax=Pyxidicoccus parkwayensis TaxID=2813578 RepID=A0ABX7P2B2_9BACT|nr:SAVED domain-containing protein [Pyxidicoccus parkwaysis]QSQ23213.1 SAVED domain-containing protein [Pyxidicoccus parkwaysis]
MSGDASPRKISLSFSLLTPVQDPHAIPTGPREYRIEHTDRDESKATFPWGEPELMQALADMEKPNPDSQVFARLGKYLQDFLRGTRWVKDEERINQASKAKRPIHVTIRSNAPELYYLPWELLKLEPSGSFLVELPNCCIRYEWPQRPPEDELPRPVGRILVAFPATDGELPFEGQLKAIAATCRKEGFEFDLDRDVLSPVTRTSLANALSDNVKPVTALHLLCHGGVKPSGAYGLRLDSVEKDRPPEHLDSEDLRPLFADARSLRLVTLCACQSGDAGRPGALVGSVAQMLNRLGVPAVISSRMPLSVPGSILMTETLYAELLGGSKDLSKAFSLSRQRLIREHRRKDWASLQLYAREDDSAALRPFVPPPAPPHPEARGELVLIRHEAYSRAETAPGPADAPELFQNRRIREVSIDHTRALESREWSKEKLEAEVRQLASPRSKLRRALAERGSELIYYGFPFIPLATLAGYLAKTRPVHVFEHDRDKKRFTWEAESSAPFPPLIIESQLHESGAAARLRLSISAPVQLEDCREVLEDEEVRLDLHCRLESPARGVIRRKSQAQSYAQQLRQMLDSQLTSNPSIQSVHIFAAVPVSIAFHLGQELNTTWMRPCYVYNFGLQEKPRYKWRMCLSEAAEGRPSVDIF